MGKYNVEISATALKALKRMPKEDVLRIMNLIKSFETDPFPYGSIKLSGLDRTYRVRLGFLKSVTEKMFISSN
jgi:mRNA-degrading endonuclease RelE of RelBE toxin-antitoxin system